MFTSKILYCQWVTLASEDDKFVINTTKPLPKWKNWSEKEHIKFIRERILRKSNDELAQVSESSQDKDDVSYNGSMMVWVGLIFLRFLNGMTKNGKQWQWQTPGL